jgi:hypothetical protein
MEQGHIGIVTSYLFQLIAKQVEDHRLVVWYDPEGVYTAAAAAFELPDTTLARYDGSFFQLRHDIDSFTREACISLVHAWRLHRDMRDSSVVTARQVEQTLGPSSIVISPSLLETKDNGQRTIDQFETFLAIERALMRHVEHALLHSADATLLELAESRLSRFGRM